MKCPCRFLLLSVVLGLSSPPASLCWAQESPPRLERDASEKRLVESFGTSASSLATWIQSANELRLTAEVVERVVTRLATMVEVTSENLSEMSSQFDPFGYKSAFQSIQQQNEIIQRQQETIQQLLQVEIRRLKVENERLKEESTRKPARPDRPAKNPRKRRQNEESPASEP